MAFGGICGECGAGSGQTHLPYCSKSEGYDKPVATKPPGMTMRVVLVNANWFDIPQPAGFSVVDYIMSVRAAGYILNHKLYVPLEQIQSIFTYDGPKPPDGQVVFPDNMTKQ